MTEHENLPTDSLEQYLAASSREHDKPDKLYRQARAVFDRGILVGGWNTTDIFSTFKILQQLVNQDYGKAYYPLSVLYVKCQNIQDGRTHVKQYSQMAFDWCFANRESQDTELWCDLGNMYWESHGVEENYGQAAYWLH
jgi:TPR repeat protein